MAELLFVDVMRRHLETLPGEKVGWLAGLRDPLVARALALLHGAPAQRWTLAALAAQTGTSRSVLAERFVRLIGQPPMQYLRQLRMQLASRLLVEDGAKVASIAAAVGFESEGAFSRASRSALAFLRTNGADDSKHERRCWLPPRKLSRSARPWTLPLNLSS